MLRFLLVAAMPLALAGCAGRGPAEFLSANSPVNSELGIRNSRQRTVLDGYVQRVPVDPKPWRQLNDSQAPGAGS